MLWPERHSLNYPSAATMRVPHQCHPSVSVAEPCATGTASQELPFPPSQFTGGEMAAQAHEEPTRAQGSEEPILIVRVTQDR